MRIALAVTALAAAASAAACGQSRIQSSKSTASLIAQSGATTTRLTLSKATTALVPQPEATTSLLAQSKATTSILPPSKATTVPGPKHWTLEPTGALHQVPGTVTSDLYAKPTQNDGSELSAYQSTSHFAIPSAAIAIIAICSGLALMLVGFWICEKFGKEKEGYQESEWHRSWAS